MSEPTTVLLFDMDGVLLMPGGYHNGLVDTVNLVGKILGFPNICLTSADIELFESVGVTSEWDSSAICATLLLNQAWRRDPSRKLPLSLPEHFDDLQLPAPDFHEFARTLARKTAMMASPLHRTEDVLFGNGVVYTADQILAIREILREARAVDCSLTHRLFQEMILGSQGYEQHYGYTPLLNVDSYLRRYDRPTLPQDLQIVLSGWIQRYGHAGAIFTNRPSTPPEGGKSTPEAEIGAVVAGVPAFPILGLGALAWLADKNKVDREAYIKPSPIHALAALYLSLNSRDPNGALAEGIEKALEAALQVINGQAAPGWDDLSGAEVYVFEDSAKGLQSAISAQECLAKSGISIQLKLTGVSDSLLKRQSLASYGAKVFPDLSAAISELSIL